MVQSPCPRCGSPVEAPGPIGLCERCAQGIQTAAGTPPSEPAGTSPCPCCGFKYGWDGRDCSHCFHSARPLPADDLTARRGRPAEPPGAIRPHARGPGDEQATALPPGRGTPTASQAAKRPADFFATATIVVMVIGGAVVLAISCCPVWLWLPCLLFAILVLANSKVSFRWKVTRERGHPPRDAEPDVRRDQSGF
jgi:hypothetical protein